MILNEVILFGRSGIYNLQTTLRRVHPDGCTFRCLIPESICIFRIIHYIILNINLFIRIYVHLFIFNQRIQVLIILLCMPSQRMSVNSKTSGFCRRNKLLYGTKVHRPVISHARSVFHGIACRHLIEIGDGHSTHHFSFQKITRRQRNSQLKVGTCVSVYICFQCIVSIEIFILGYTFRLLSLEVNDLVIGTRGKQ